MADNETQHVSDGQLQEQLQYYSDRAPEYDDWWYRRGTFDKGPDENATWFHDAEVALSVLRNLDLGKTCVELAAGTGTWSTVLAPRVDRLVLVDGSREMLFRNAVADEAHVATEIADLFAWNPTESFDSVVFTFWISHVPEERLDGFFALVASLLRDGGNFFFVDDLPSATSEPHVSSTSGQTMVRKLNNGQTATIVKNFYSDERLLNATRAAGLDLTLTHSDKYFLVGAGRKNS